MAERKNKVDDLTIEDLDNLEVGDVIRVKNGIDESLVFKWAKENNREVVTHSNTTLWLKR